MKKKSKNNATPRSGNNAKLRSDLGAWMLMLPSLVLFAFFVWVPLLETVRMSFYEVNGTTLVKFVGFENYRKLFIQPAFSIAWGNTVKYTLCSLIVGLAVPVIIAALITEMTHFRGFFRLAAYYPNVIPGIAAVMIYSIFFTSGDGGVLNILLAKIGVGPVAFLTDKAWVIFWIVVAMTWKAAGSTALVYMSSMAGISPDLYEAATIDGASPLRRFFSITMPTILRTGKTMLILQILAVFQILYEPMMMTNGGPNNASISIMQLVYKLAFEQLKMSQAAALSVEVCIILIILTAIYYMVANSGEKE
ncbi:MAG: sugar ABC transporter permease [Lachnospiraceae bacterium]|nr:sugar ABC transporter permease [Lachnospiraceae bacterium]